MTSSTKKLHSNQLHSHSLEILFLQSLHFKSPNFTPISIKSQDTQRVVSRKIITRLTYYQASSLMTSSMKLYSNHRHSLEISFLQSLHHFKSPNFDNKVSDTQIVSRKIITRVIYYQVSSFFSLMTSSTKKLHSNHGHSLEISFL